MASDETKILLRESEMPQRWYNIQPDLPAPLAPPIHPGTGQPLGPADLAPIFPMELIKQEVSQEKWIEIPDDVRKVSGPKTTVIATAGCSANLPGPGVRVVKPGDHLKAGGVEIDAVPA